MLTNKHRNRTIYKMTNGSFKFVRIPFVALTQVWSSKMETEHAHFVHNESSHNELCTYPISAWRQVISTYSRQFIIEGSVAIDNANYISHYFPAVATHFLVCSTDVSTSTMPSSGVSVFLLQTKHYLNVIVCGYIRFWTFQVLKHFCREPPYR